MYLQISGQKEVDVACVPGVPEFLFSGVCVRSGVRLCYQIVLVEALLDPGKVPVYIAVYQVVVQVRKCYVRYLFIPAVLELDDLEVLLNVPVFVIVWVDIEIVHKDMLSV